MVETRQIIDQLAGRATPVRPLACPLQRTALWLAFAAALIALTVASYGLRPDLARALAVPAVALEWAGSLATGLLAAYAVFQVSVPGRSRAWAWLPLPALLLWLGSIGAGCVADWQQLGSAAWTMEQGSWDCAQAITVMSLPLGLTLLLMVRHAGVVRPASSALLGGLSAAALSAAGVSLFHHGESALMVLLWHLGAVLLVSLLSWLFGRRLFGWIGYRPS